MPKWEEKQNTSIQDEIRRVKDYKIISYPPEQINRYFIFSEKQQ